MVHDSFVSERERDSFYFSELTFSTGSVRVNSNKGVEGLDILFWCNRIKYSLYYSIFPIFLKKIKC